ncbi:MAG: hypothetical protein IJP49_02455 [Bacteroidales bacterium]|jgi:hypothetical protein|nr:hypothetical protein [Bacteroidales bacterium]MBR0052906.1 hypothetical protein [Bacteroidales bacterium]
MKTLDEINRLSAEDLERISLDKSIPVPKELSARVQAAVDRKDDREPVHLSARKYGASVFAVAAAISLFALGAVLLNRERAPKDTFDDPYLAYAEVEKAFAKISSTVAYGASKITDSEQTLDKYSYWK